MSYKLYLNIKLIRIKLVTLITFVSILQTFEVANIKTGVFYKHNL